MHCWSPEPTRKSKRIFREKVCIEIVVFVGGIISKLKLESKVTRVREYSAQSADRACIQNIKTDLIIYCALWKPRRISRHMKQCSHEPLPLCQLCRQCSASIYSIYVQQVSIFSVYVQQGKQ